MRTEQTRSVRNVKYDYRLADGTPVPGVTTIVGLRDKGYLKNWAFRIGQQNPYLKSIWDYTDDLARIGSCAHLLITSELRGVEPDLSDYTPREVKAARVPLEKFHRWQQGKVITVHSVEEQIVSERYRVGGTLDVYAVIDGLFAVVDVKTSARISKSHMEQDSAYAELKKERGDPVDRVWVLQIGRNADEGFTEKILADWRNYWMHFLTLRQLYDIEKASEKGEIWTPPSTSLFSPTPPAPMEQPEAWQPKPPNLRVL